MTNRDALLCVVTSFTAGFAFTLAICEPARSSDNGVIPNPTSHKVEDTAPATSEGCNPYVVIYPPDLPPDASNMNGVTIELSIGDICGDWRSQPQIVPALPLKPA